jgi:hypothetical protein
MNRLLARQRLFVVTNAVQAYVDLTPPVGSAYEVVWASGSHDEGAPLNCLWALEAPAGGTFRDLCNTFALASATLSQFYASCYFQAPLVLRYGMSLRFATALKTAGKIAIITVDVNEWLGETPYVG